ncbi:hypothetical protein SteCoe_15557 [Stentor coeruleus]|uniref:RING-type domain-containing protein n=1 Tax=Stentor coeruleus TaxID=5963 RepID=A0A1R2C3L4_9CILI|nr:hypothetical protein SteCoe_15557 [Stentor coeruleus]
MEQVSNIQEISRRQSFAPAQNSSEFAFIMSYFFLSRHCQHFGDNSMRQAMFNVLRETNFSDFFNQIFENLTKSTLDSLAQTSQTWTGIENIFRQLNITSANSSSQDNLCKLSKRFNVAIQLYGSLTQILNATTGRDIKIIKIIYYEPAFYACASREVDALHKENISQNIINSSQGIKPEIFKAIVEGFLTVNDFINQENRDSLINHLQKCKNKKELAESVETLNNYLSNCGACAKHDYACFECRTVHCKTCFLRKYQENGVMNCPCGKSVSMSLINLLSNISPTITKPIDSPKKIIAPPPNPKERLMNYNPLNPSMPQTNQIENPNFTQRTEIIIPPNNQNLRANLPGNTIPLNLYNQPGVQNNLPNLYNQLGVQNNPPNLYNQPGVQNNPPNSYNQPGVQNNPPNLYNQPGVQNNPPSYNEPYQGNFPGYFQESPTYPRELTRCSICMNQCSQDSISIFCQAQHIYCNNCYQLSSGHCSICNGWSCFTCKKFILVGDEKYQVENFYIHKMCYEYMTRSNQ